jgi:hypothetical protein
MARQAPALAPKLVANADLIFAMAAALAKERGAAFFLLFLVGADECKSGAYYFDLDRLETPFTSLMPSCPEDPAALRFAIDPHYNEAGQRWLAAAILDFLERNVLRAAPDDHTM